MWYNTSWVPLFYIHGYALDLTAQRHKATQTRAKNRQNRKRRKNSR